jgi:hypothetical protein
MGKFSGNSFDKNWARSNAYREWARGYSYRKVDIKQDYGKKHIIIVGSGGDYHWLKAAGMEDENIIGCDIDTKARALAKQSGMILSPHGDFNTTVEWAITKYGEGNIATVNADLCKTINDLSYLGKLFDILPKSITAYFTFLRARDKFNGTDARIDHLSNFATKHNRVLYKHWEYQSTFANHLGSPMCMVMFV